MRIKSDEFLLATAIAGNPEMMKQLQVHFQKYQQEMNVQGYANEDTVVEMRNWIDHLSDKFPSLSPFGFYEHWKRGGFVK